MEPSQHTRELRGCWADNLEHAGMWHLPGHVKVTDSNLEHAGCLSSKVALQGHSEHPSISA